MKLGLKNSLWSSVLGPVMASRLLAGLRGPFNYSKRGTARCSSICCSLLYCHVSRKCVGVCVSVLLCCGLVVLLLPIFHNKKQMSVSCSVSGLVSWQKGLYIGPEFSLVTTEVGED